MKVFQIEYVEHTEQFIPWFECVDIIADNEQEAKEIFSLLYGVEIVSIEERGL